MCQIARQRGYPTDLYVRYPVHATIKEQLRRLGVGLHNVDDLLPSGVGAVRRLSSYDVIHLNLFHPRSRIALMSYLAFPAKVLYVDHVSGVAADRRQPQTLKERLRTAVDAWSMVRVHSLAGVSKYVTNRGRERYRLQAHRARTIYNGIDVERFVSSRNVDTVKRSQGGLSVVTVCWLRKEKGVDQLILGVSLAKNRDIKLTVVGDGSELESLQALARDRGLEERVAFVGLQDDVPAFLDGADVFVHPATWDEAFGLTITEAMAMKKPVIATRAGGIPEIIDDKQNGLLVEPGNAAEIAQALDLLASSPDLRTQLGENARRKVISHFELGNSARSHIDWCEEAWRGRGRTYAEERGTHPVP